LNFILNEAKDLYFPRDPSFRFASLSNLLVALMPRWISAAVRKVAIFYRLIPGQITHIFRVEILTIYLFVCLSSKKPLPFNL
jgi:hypothetical protein